VGVLLQVQQMLVPLMVREVSQNNFGLTNSAVWWCDVEIPEINDMIRCLFITIAKYFPILISKKVITNSCIKKT